MKPSTTAPPVRDLGKHTRSTALSGVVTLRMRTKRNPGVMHRGETLVQTQLYKLPGIKVKVKNKNKKSHTSANILYYAFIWLLF